MGLSAASACLALRGVEVAGIDPYLPADEVHFTCLGSVPTCPHALVPLLPLLA